jgi:hypothetical protein
MPVSLMMLFGIGTILISPLVFCQLMLILQFIQYSAIRRTQPVTLRRLYLWIECCEMSEIILYKVR